MNQHDENRGPVMDPLIPGLDAPSPRCLEDLPVKEPPSHCNLLDAQVSADCELNILPMVASDNQQSSSLTFGVTASALTSVYSETTSRQTTKISRCPDQFIASSTEGIVSALSCDLNQHSPSIDAVRKMHSPSVGPFVAETNNMIMNLEFEGDSIDKGASATFKSLSRQDQLSIIKCLDLARNELLQVEISAPGNDSKPTGTSNQPLMVQALAHHPPSTLVSSDLVSNNLPLGVSADIPVSCDLLDQPSILLSTSCLPFNYTPTQPCFTIISWNIAGWVNKGNDPDFLRLLRSFQVVLLQETWMQLPVTLGDFNCFSLPAKKCNSKGRPSGGLAILVVDQLRVQEVAISLSSCSVQAVKLFGTICNFIIINVYIHPSLPSIHRQQVWDDLLSLVDDLRRDHPGSELILAGDLNARVGKANQIFTKAFKMDATLPFPLSCSLERASKDHFFNANGLALARFACMSNMSWLNGLTEFPDGREFTFVSSRGTSVVDYILISNPLKAQVRNFYIGDATSSDHLPLILTLDLSVDNINAVPDSVNTMLAPPKISVKDNLCTKFQQLIMETPCTALFTRIVSVADPSIILSLYKNLLDILHKSLGSKSVPSVNQPNSRNHWFDKECRDLKVLTRSLYLEFRNSGNHSDLINYSLSKQFLATIILTKKEKFAQSLWKDLVLAIQLKNSKRIWEIVNRSVNPFKQTFHSIAPSNWIAHFSGLFFDKSKSVSVHPALAFSDLPYWPPVTPEEVRDLIGQLKKGKAAGPDNIPPDLLLADPAWWAEILAPLFTAANNSGLYPDNWTTAIIVPIFKKGDPLLPVNYRPISLLSVIGKVYAKYLAKKLTSWIHTHKILGPEQSGFCKGKSTMDNCVILSHLAHKQLKLRAKLYVAFLDLRSAFDSIDRDLLWYKLSKLGIDRRLLMLIQSLHHQSSCQVRCNRNASVTTPIEANKGVKQGCILAPSLFNLFINDLAPWLLDVDSHCPKLGSHLVPLLLYADDAVLLARTQIGLRRLIYRALEYFDNNNLSINFEKSKILVFSSHWKRLRWVFKGKEFEQVKLFKYLGVHFNYNLSWAPHCHMSATAANVTSSAIARFYFNQGNQYIPAALTAFKAMVQAQILFGAQVWFKPSFIKYERTQAAFLRKILGLPRCVPYAVLCLETGCIRIKSMAWLRLAKFWLRLLFEAPASSLLTQVLLDSVLPQQLADFHARLKTIGLDMELLGMVEFKEAFRRVKLRVFDIERQELGQAAYTSCSPLRFAPLIELSKVAIYLTVLTNPQERRALSLARCNVLPSAVTAGRFAGIPIDKRTCLCNGSSLETVEHILFDCTKNSKLRQHLLDPLLVRLVGWKETAKLQFLLSSQDAVILSRTAAFLLGAMTARQCSGGTDL